MWYVSPDGTVYTNWDTPPPDFGATPAYIHPWPPTSDLDYLQKISDMHDNSRINNALADLLEAKARNEQRNNRFRCRL